MVKPNKNKYVYYHQQRVIKEDPPAFN